MPLNRFLNARILYYLLFRNAVFTFFIKDIRRINVYIIEIEFMERVGNLSKGKITLVPENKKQENKKVFEFHFSSKKIKE